MTSRHVKKAVVCMAELIAALVPIHGLLTFLTDVNRLLDPSGGTVWLSVIMSRSRRTGYRLFDESL